MNAPGRVLVVDDDAGILRVVVEILRDEGYEVDQATNGSEALQLLDRGELPRLVILDMRMPVLNGWEFAQAMRQRRLDVPILVMTAAANARRWADEIQAAGYISKPFEIDRLVREVRRAMGGEPESDVSRPVQLPRLLPWRRLGRASGLT